MRISPKTRSAAGLAIVSVMPVLACASAKTTLPGNGQVGSDAGADAGDASNGTPTFPPCESPTPQIGPDGRPTGYVTCANRSVHRVEKHACLRTPRTFQCAYTEADGGALPGGCVTDADCTEHPYGYCTTTMGARPPCRCGYGCREDADCRSGEICVCGDPEGACVPAACTVDAECGAGLCSTYFIDSNSACSGSPTIIACQTPADACGGDGDCPAGNVCSIPYLQTTRACILPPCVP